MLAQPDTDNLAHGGTESGTLDTILILEELRLLREDVAKTRQIMRLIWRKPDEPSDRIDVGRSNTVRPWWKLGIFTNKTSLTTSKGFL